MKQPWYYRETLRKINKNLAKRAASLEEHTNSYEAHAIREAAQERQAAEKREGQR
jgi:hypothetical protein